MPEQGLNDTQQLAHEPEYLLADGGLRMISKNKFVKYKYTGDTHAA